MKISHLQACMVETDESDSNNVAQETVTFLYKLSSGACPKSYGFNAARLAGIQKEIIERAHKISMQIEKEANIVSLFKRTCTAIKSSSHIDLKGLIAACQKISL